MTFTGAKGVYREEGSYDFTIGALDNFWRGAENPVARDAGVVGRRGRMLWAVAGEPAAACARRPRLVSLAVHLRATRPGMLGGFLANSELDGTLVRLRQSSTLAT